MSSANIMPLLIAGLAITSVFLLSAGLMTYLGGDSNVARLKERLESSRGRSGEGSDDGPGRFFSGFSRLLTTMGRKLGPKDEETLTKTQLALLQAGIRGHRSPVVFQGIKAFGTLAMAGSALIARSFFFKELPLHWTIILILIPAALGCYGPELWLKLKTTKRRERISDELPDALDLLVVCVESGMGLDQAIHRVSTELYRSAPLLSQELKTVTLQMRAGKPRQEALRDLSRRVGLDDLNSLCTLLIQADVFGISVSKTLRVYSDVLRTNRYQRAEEKAAKLPVKLLFPLIFFILPALFVAIMGPAGIRMVGVLDKMK